MVIVWRCTLHLHEPIKKLSLGNLRDFIEHRPLIRSTVINQFGTFIRGIKVFSPSVSSLSPFPYFFSG